MSFLSTFRYHKFENHYIFSSPAGMRKQSTKLLAIIKNEISFTIKRTKTKQKKNVLILLYAFEGSERRRLLQKLWTKPKHTLTGASCSLRVIYTRWFPRDSLCSLLSFLRWAQRSTSFKARRPTWKEEPDDFCMFCCQPFCIMLLLCVTLPPFLVGYCGRNWKPKRPISTTPTAVGHVSVTSYVLEQLFFLWLKLRFIYPTLNTKILSSLSDSEEVK